MKRCPRCGIAKPLEDFGVNRRRTDGRGYACLPCEQARRRSGPVCTVEGCTRPAQAVGLCTTHYSRSRKGAPLDAPVKRRVPCGVAGCSYPAGATSVGVCRRHYTELLGWIKLVAGCARCGYMEHPHALQFDHLPGTAKAFELGTSSSRTLEAIEAELAKCQVLCANCHAVTTAERRAS